MGRCVVVVRDYLLDFPSVEVEERRGLTTKRGTLKKQAFSQRSRDAIHDETNFGPSVDIGEGE